MQNTPTATKAINTNRLRRTTRVLGLILGSVQLVMVVLIVWGLLTLSVGLTWGGASLPMGFLLLCGVGVFGVYRLRGTAPRTARLLAFCYLAQLVTVGSPWMLLWCNDWSYRATFVRLGQLPPNEILGAEFPLVMSLLLLSIAAAAGLPLLIMTSVLGSQPPRET